ncbi:MAG: alpha/beta hydrolase-fold protein, partial [Rhodothermales bacterium]|nr:alpha/beta hydrolase-fold protein [Rhodothermales bacterium]
PYMTEPTEGLATAGDGPAPPAEASVAGPWRNYPPEPAHGEHTVVGELQILEGLYSPELDNRRNVITYLPPSYGDGTRRYPVIYMHDGQNLFDEVTSFAEEWGVDNTMEVLSLVGLEAIVVGVFNAGEHRLDEYSPFEDAEGRGGKGDRYLDFLVDTLKPRIDRDFRTRPERDHTAIVGSSMGGLISLYAFFRRPDVFGKAGVMSPSLWFADRAIFPFVEEAAFNPGKVYLDVGTLEGERTVADTRRLRELLLRKAYRRHRDLVYVEQPGAGHSETAWRQRLHFAIDFLLREVHR